MVSAASSAWHCSRAQSSASSSRRPNLGDRVIGGRGLLRLCYAAGEKRGGRVSTMPRFEKMPQPEAQQLNRRGTPRVDMSEYTAFLQKMQPGEWGRITLAEGGSPRTAKRRCTTACRQLGRTARYRRA